MDSPTPDNSPLDKDAAFAAIAAECAHDHVDLDSTDTSTGYLLVTCLDCEHRLRLISPSFDSAWWEAA